MANQYRRITQNHNGPKPKPTLGELIESTNHSIGVMEQRGFSREAIRNQVVMLNIYNSLAARLGETTQFSKVPAAVYNEVVKAVMI